MTDDIRETVERAIGETGFEMALREKVDDDGRVHIDDLYAELDAADRAIEEEYEKGNLPRWFAVGALGIAHGLKAQIEDHPKLTEKPEGEG